jgi:hypothetical protein
LKTSENYDLPKQIHIYYITSGNKFIFIEILKIIKEKKLINHHIKKTSLDWRVKIMNIISTIRKWYALIFFGCKIMMRCRIPYDHTPKSLMREVSPVRATKRLSQEIPKGTDRLEGFYNKENLYQNMIKNRKLLKRREKKKKTEFDQAYNQNTWSFKHMHAFKERVGNTSSQTHSTP